MQPGLSRLGTDFGNGLADARCFQFDENAASTLDLKRAILERESARNRVLARSEAEIGAHRAVIAWLFRTLATEAPESWDANAGDALSVSAAYDFVARRVQEDFVVIRRDASGLDEAISVYVCFPSGWRPERILGESFVGIHAPVPEFDAVRRAAPSLVDAMIERGPYVRFVWTLSADAVLDHHPEYGTREPLATANSGYLRVERQVTVPFPAAQSSLFLIRTYLYPFAALSAEERRVLAQAVQAMSPEIARYKGLLGAESRILELLEPLPRAEPNQPPAFPSKP